MILEAVRCNNYQWKKEKYRLIRSQMAAVGRSVNECDEKLKFVVITLLAEWEENSAVIWMRTVKQQRK